MDLDGPFIFQGVHIRFDWRFDPGWGKEERGNCLVMTDRDPHRECLDMGLRRVWREPRSFLMGDKQWPNQEIESLLN